MVLNPGPFRMNPISIPKLEEMNFVVTNVHGKVTRYNLILNFDQFRILMSNFNLEFPGFLSTSLKFRIMSDYTQERSLFNVRSAIVDLGINEI